MFAGADGDFVQSNDNFTLTLTTQDNGSYLFENLPNGGFLIDVIENTAPGGLTPTTFDIDADNDAMTTVNLTDGNKSRADVDFGFVGERATAGRFLFDANNSGDADGDDEGLGDVDVTLTFAGGDDDFDSTADNLAFLTSTDSNGNYSFANLPEGEYQITFEPTTLPDQLS